MIAEKASDLLRSSVDALVPDLELDRAVVVLEIAVRGQRTEVHPTPQVYMPYEAVVGFVVVAEENARFHFTPYATLRTERASSADSPSQEVRLAHRVKRSANPGMRAHVRMRPQDDRSFARIEDRAVIDAASLTDPDRGTVLGGAISDSLTRLGIAYPALEIWR